MNTNKQADILRAQFEDVDSAAEWILANCQHSRVLCFVGELGAGKTTTIKACCQKLGYDGEVTSPTYAIINEYTADLSRIYHMDLYRLNDLEEALDIGLEEYLYDETAYSMIEWPRLVQDHFDVDRYDILISRVSLDSEARSISIVFVSMNNL
jgi:tRNA threonylcarbamoyladenosine biosynthesis protein TsaE